MPTQLKILLLKYRRLLVVTFHVVVIGLSSYLAFYIRFDGQIPPQQKSVFWQLLPWLVLIRGIVFYPFHLYEGLWRYSGIWDLRNIILGVFTSSLLFFLIFVGILGGHPLLPWTIPVIDSILLVCFLGGIRFARRIYREFGHRYGGKRILILGAGDAGEMIVRDMKHSPSYNYKPIGFVDDDIGKTGHTIHGVKVLGTRNDLPSIFTQEAPQEILVAMPTAGPAKIREIVKALEPFNVPIKTLPNLSDILDGKISLNQIRNLSIEDLLERSPVHFTPEPVRHLIEGKNVLVTGAGGSIGSELCRQIIALNPKKLILSERHENSLYEVLNHLSNLGVTDSLLYPAVGDISNRHHLEDLFDKSQPDLIFHAAAHKHVPLMELNPCEAARNNILGTQILADSAARFGVERFILISSDKAVNPSSVMGSTKRVAEYIMQIMNKRSRTTFATVRFGNVLGSSGSVVPRFLEQIKAGGPVTVTHPEMRRYFMLIPEAVQLVLHAAALAKAGEIFVLEMGEQIKIVDLARNLIRLAGFIPDHDISVTFTGLRPGEKLYEELVATDEHVEPSGMKKILRINSHLNPDVHLLLKISEIARLVEDGNEENLVQKLCEIVPTYHPVGRNAIHDPQGKPISDKTFRIVSQPVS